MRTVVAALVAAVFTLPATATTAATTSEMDQALTWAETAYPGLLPTSGMTKATSGGYYYRYYPQTAAYLGAKDDGLYYFAGGLSGIVTVGSLTNFLGVAKSCDLTRSMGSAGSILSGKASISFEDTTGVSTPKGLKQRYLIKNTSTQALYLQVDATVTKHRVMLMSPQPGYIYLAAGEQFQGMLVYEVDSGTATGSLSFSTTFTVQELSLTDGKTTGATASVATTPSFTLTASTTPTVSSTATNAVSYERTATVNTKVGFWRHATDSAQSKIVLFPGQENWTDSSAVTTATIYAYTLDGSALWQRTAGADVWGGDMSADGKYVAYATLGATAAQSTLYLLDGSSGTEIWKATLNTTNFPRPSSAKLPAPTDALDVREVKFSPSGKLIAFGTARGLVYLIDRDTKAIKWAFETFGQARGISFDATESALFVGSGDGYLYKVDLATGQQLWKTAIIAWPYSAPAIAPNGNWIAAGSKTGEVVVADTNTGNCLAAYDLGIMTVRKTLFAPDGATLYTASGTPGGSPAWSTLSWQANYSTTMSADTSVTSDSTYQLVADGPTAQLLDARTGQLVTSLDTGFAKGSNYYKVVFVSHSGNNVVIARRDTSPDAVNIAFFKKK